MEDRRRVVLRPRGPDYPGNGVVNQERSQLIATVHNSFEEARRLRQAAGFSSCIGLLDPVSNIAVSATFSDTVTAEDLERRSVDGMVVFLTTFFPYLTDWEAVHYLLLAHAHLLGAACLVLKDRAMETSAGHVDSMLRTALKCAALAARHPEPDRLVAAWLSLSLRQLYDIVAGDLSTVRLGELAGDAAKKSWELAASRQQLLELEGDVPYYYHTTSLRRALLDKVHRHYLRALARLPRLELRGRYHRALLAGGGCYGPLDDPASNVVLNIVWYDATSPPARRDGEEEPVDMIGADALARAASRSVYGILSFLCTRFDGLSEHDAVRCLLDADADVQAAARDAERRGYQARAGSTLQDAYVAAATAAGHPDANAQAAFLAQGALGLQLETPEDVLALAEVLALEPPPEPGAPKAATKLYWAIIRDRRRQFRGDQARIARMARAALEQYNESSSTASAYELDVICGVNEDVDGPAEIPSTDSRSHLYPYIYHRSHINFLATNTSGATPARPVLFFAECSNYDDQGEPPLCVPVGLPPPRASLVRCLYCDGKGGTVVHPASTQFHGRDKEFQLAARGGKQVQQLYRNEYIIQTSEHHAQSMCALLEDSMYVDSDGASSDDDQDLLSTCEFDA
ncbi:hypothetical protein QYE76_008986 [Lolium multiflorum]|uniref:Uncharacterized protein n=1 Tax=Lolium multiflorum TaxID=4521 RepID=A0AAD8TUC3_LOLMU|nr:hypothetical protein QYE76_008986 [Lolium multiflorum]